MFCSHFPAIRQKVTTTGDDVRIIACHNAVTVSDGSFAVTPRLRFSSHRTKGLRIRQAHCTDAKLPTGPNYDSLSSEKQRQLREYIEELLEWNQKVNITAIRNREEAMRRHVEDSLSLLPVLHLEGVETLRVIDVGSGGGLPGVILAIARPEWEVTLLDSLRKRCDFVSSAVQRLGLSNVTVVCARAEDVGRDEAHREAYDVAVARAVAEMRLLNELCLPLVRIGGLLVAAKGPDPSEELQAAGRSLSELRGELKGVFPVESYGQDGQQFTAVVVEKAAPCPPKYPRRPGMPKKRPL